MVFEDKFTDEVSLVLRMHHESSARIEHNAHVQIPAASTIKVLIMASVMKAFGERLDERIVIEKDNIAAYSLSTELTQREYSLHDLILLMIDVSDNSATNQLIDLIGMEAINGLAKRIGMESTRLNRKMMDMESKAAGRDNVTSVMDLFTLMEAIRLGKLTGHLKMIEILSKNRDRYMLARYVGEEHFLAHKTGLNEDIVIDFGFDQQMTIAMAVSGVNVEVEGSDLIGKMYRHYWEGR